MNTQGKVKSGKVTWTKNCFLGGRALMEPSLCERILQNRWQWIKVLQLREGK